MSKKKNPLVFLDVSIDEDPAERIFIEVMQSRWFNFYLEVLQEETEVWFSSIEIKIKTCFF
jgi:hypothetical protein